MPRKMPIFYSALLLTGVNLLLRLAGTSFQVYISSRIGAAGVGLLQLVLSVGAMATTAAMAGIRTGTMYLTAEELGRKRPGSILWVLSGCFLYSLICSGIVAGGVFVFAPLIAEKWIGDPYTADAIRLLAASLPMVCLCGVMTGYFTGANRIGTLAAVEVAEQIFSMGVTLSALTFWAGESIHKACVSVVMGSIAGCALTLSSLVILRLRERASSGKRIPLARRLMETAAPLALADDLKAGINTTENLMVPKRLALYPGTASPLAAFGMVCGMVFPILTFPSAILFGLAELLIPELARCNAAQSHGRIHYLVRRSLRVAMIYGIFFSGLLFLFSRELCVTLYGSAEAGKYLRQFALLVPMLYCDTITDAMTKGLGQQKICVRYNIITSALDVVFLFLLLPRFGMQGYFFSFLLTHLLNFCLSLRRLLKITGEHIRWQTPALSLLCLLLAVLGADTFSSIAGRLAAYLGLLGSLLFLLRVTGKEDLLWLKGLIYKK